MLLMYYKFSSFSIYIYTEMSKSQLNGSVTLFEWYDHQSYINTTKRVEGSIKYFKIKETTFFQSCRPKFSYHTICKKELIDLLILRRIQNI